MDHALPPPAREMTGPHYSRDALRAAQAESWRVLDAMAAAIRPGMRESEAAALAGDILTRHAGLETQWHPLVIRFGPNTLKLFREAGDGDRVLGDDDIFFIDIGPVFGGHEGDVGATFVTGSDPDMAAAALAARTLFDRVRAIWDHGAVSGIALYQAAAQEAAQMGWVLNLEVKGHRVSDYPHRALPDEGRLAALDAAPGAGLWILEIQIRHPTRAFGAFYEDLLD